VQAAASGLARRLLLAGGVALAVWVVAAGSGLVTDPARRNRAVKVVKEKVCEGVEVCCSGCDLELVLWALRVLL
jgi:hypothetical protein